MNITEFISLLEHPNAITKEHTIELKDILDKYPYFQAARVIYLKGLKKQHSFKYNNALKTTAAYTTDRTVLFDFITADTLLTSQYLENENQVISNSEIIDLEVVKKPLISTPVGSTNTNDQIKSTEQELEIGKPLAFDTSEMYSFNEWLQVTTSKPIERKEKEKLSSQKGKNEKFDLIEQFIKNKPKIKPSTTTENTNIAVKSVTENEDLMTETLARVYLEQKQYDKAMQAFKILSLKYPEKSGFFADRIKAIKFLKNNNT